MACQTCRLLGAGSLLCRRCGPAIFSADDWEPSAYRSGPRKGQPCLRHRTSGETKDLSAGAELPGGDPRPPSPLSLEGSPYDPPAIPKLASLKVSNVGAAKMARLFGPDHAAKMNLLAAASNAVEGAEVVVHVTGINPTGVTVTVTADGLQATRDFSRDEAGRLVVKNQYFRTETGSRHDGNGAAIFLNQVRALRALGVSGMSCSAAGDFETASQENGFNGYVTWPKFGYDAKIQPYTVAKLPEYHQKRLGREPTIQELLDLPGGGEAWEIHGGDVLHAVFDLSDGSASMQRLGAYLEGRRRRRGQPRRADRGLDDPDWRTRMNRRKADLEQVMAAKIRDSRPFRWWEVWRIFG